MTWNHDWPEPERCPSCATVIGVRRCRTCGNCGETLDREGGLPPEKLAEIDTEIEQMRVDREARKAAEERRREEQLRKDRSSYG